MFTFFFVADWDLIVQWFCGWVRLCSISRNGLWERSMTSSSSLSYHSRSTSLSSSSCSRRTSSSSTWAGIYVHIMLIQNISSPLLPSGDHHSGLSDPNSLNNEPRSSDDPLVKNGQKHKIQVPQESQGCQVCCCLQARR